MAESRKGDEIQIKTGNVKDSMIVGKIVLHAPQPGVRAETVFVNRKAEDGSGYQTRARLSLTNPYAAHALLVEVQGKGIAGLEVRKAPTQRELQSGVIMDSKRNVQQTLGPTGATFSCAGPLEPAYFADIVTTEPGELEMTATVDTA